MSIQVVDNHNRQTIQLRGFSAGGLSWRQHGLEVCSILAIFALIAQLAIPAVQAWFNRPRAGHQTEVWGESCPYLIYLPQEYKQGARSAWPLLLHLHGAGERGSDFRRVRGTGLPALIAEGKHLPMIVVSPQCPADRGWEMEHLQTLLDNIHDDYNVGAVFITGYSMGGHGTWELASTIPDRITAIVPICGSGNPSSATRLKDIPIWAFHGAKDNVVPLNVSSEMIDAVKAVGGNAKLTTFPRGGHSIWQAVYKDENVYQWLLTHKGVNHDSP